MAVLRKANFHPVEICRLMKTQSCKRIQREKLIKILYNFFPAVKLFMRF